MQFINITSLDIPELEIYKIKKEVQLLRLYEPELGIFIAESAKVIRRALDAGYEPISMVTSLDNPDEEVAQIYKEFEGLPIYYGDDLVLRELLGYALSGGIFAAMKRKELPSLDGFINKRKIIAVLEDVENPTNVGSIFRSAAAMNIDGIILTSDSADPLYRRSQRVSMGTVFQIPWTKIEKKMDYISYLSEKGFTTVAMALSDDSVNINDPAIKEKEKLAVILGNEGYGLRSETISRSDYVAKIPMNPIVDSLNVAAASAVMFWELSKCQHAEK